MHCLVGWWGVWGVWAGGLGGWGGWGGGGGWQHRLTQVDGVGIEQSRTPPRDCFMMAIRCAPFCRPKDVQGCSAALVSAAG